MTHGQSIKPGVFDPVKELIKAVMTSDLDTIKLMLENDPKLAHSLTEIEGENTWTPMQFAISVEDQDIFNLFVELTEYLDWKDEAGCSLAQFCAKVDNRLEKLILLANKGADLNTISKDGFGLMKTALLFDAPKIAGFLLTRGVAVDLDWAKSRQLSDASTALVTSYAARAQAMAVIDEVSAPELKSPS